ncbi:MAG: ROK family protein [Bacteroidaceae bacterium]|nr:ROK family protein [Bacteroidaceae bacterium]
MNTQKTYAIGVDLGGTNTVFGIVDRSGNILAQASIKTQAYPTAEAFVEVGVQTLLPLIQQVGGIDQIAGMGIGAPNANYYTGAIETAPNIAWAHERIVPLAQMFSSSLSPLSPVFLTNDANAAAMGEMAYGAARHMKDFIVITLGTGVGSGIVTGGQLLYGHDGFAGELGHVIMVRGQEGRPCGCGRTGCLETYCSATGVARTARELLTTTDRPSLLRQKPLDQIESLDVSIAASQGDQLALDIFRFTGTLLGQACADFAAFSSPEAFIFFGGLCRAGELIMQPIREAYERSVMPIYRGKAQFLVSPLMDTNAAVLGASALVWGDQK